MDTLAYACIAPHGSEIIPQLAGNSKGRFEKTRKGMLELARRVKETRPDTIVVASPHNLRLYGRMGVVVSENTAGELIEGGGRAKMKSGCDVGLAWKIVREAEKRGLPVVAANYGTSSGQLSCIQMDWGTFVPLWFFIKLNKLKSRVVIVTPSREISNEQNFLFGRVIGEVSETARKKIVFVASADQAHAHSAKGPYGFSSDAKKYDTRVLEIIKNGDLRTLLQIDQRLIENAKPDSLWQMIMLAGLLEVAPMKGELISYQVPTYYGMLCAGFSRTY